MGLSYCEVTVGWLRVPQTHVPGSELRSTQGAHNPALPTAERYDGAADQFTERALRALSTVRKLGTRKQGNWRLDPVPKSQTPDM